MKKHIKCYLILLTTILLNSQSIAQINGKLIGEQIWTTSNLNVSKFQNGDVIFEAKTKAQWVKANEEKKPAWCYYQNNPQNGVIYGKLYNWYAVNDPRGLTPKGWHIPTNNEWEEMVSFLQKDFKDVNETLKTKTGWKQYETGGKEVGSDCEYCNGTGRRYSNISYKYITCAICGGTGGDRRFVKKRILSGNGTNISGFSAKPGANRFDNGGFNEYVGEVAIWWSSSESKSDGKSYGITLSNDLAIPIIEEYIKDYGSSIRLVKDKSKDVLEKERVAKEEKRIIDSISSIVLDSVNISGNTITLDKLIIAKIDLPKKMSWDNAQIACSQLGFGWRLPTNDELNLLFQNKAKIGGFKNDGYWSSVENDLDNVWHKDFNQGKFTYGNKYNGYMVRAVKDNISKQQVIDSANVIIGNSIKIGNLIVAQYDFKNKLSLSMAKIACSKLGNGWRLPTSDELNILFENREKIGGFAPGYYWSKTNVSYDNDFIWVQDFSDGKKAGYFKDNPNFFRAVKSL